MHLKREAVEFGLVVNASKTKYVQVDGIKNIKIRLGNNVAIDVGSFEVVNELVYL